MVQTGKSNLHEELEGGGEWRRIRWMEGKGGWKAKVDERQRWRKGKGGGKAKVDERQRRRKGKGG